ncbi:MAG: hypothetical protein QXU98_01715 [Candidatus Parvarchaeota archaeon]
MNLDVVVNRSDRQYIRIHSFLCDEEYFEIFNKDKAELARAAIFMLVSPDASKLYPNFKLAGSWNGKNFFFDLFSTAYLEYTDITPIVFETLYLGGYKDLILSMISNLRKNTIEDPVGKLIREGRYANALLHLNKTPALEWKPEYPFYLEFISMALRRNGEI